MTTQPPSRVWLDADSPDSIDEDSITIEVRRVTDGMAIHTVIYVTDKFGLVGGASGSTFAKAVDAMARMFGDHAGDAS